MREQPLTILLDPCAGDRVGRAADPVARNAPLILDFLNHIEATRKNGSRSRNARLAAIKSFFRFLEYRQRFGP